MSARSAKNRRPALAPPNAVTVTLGWSAAKASLKGQREKHTRNGGQRSACASSRRVRNTGSAVASAHPIVPSAPISRVKSSASGAMVTGVFHAPLSDAISEEVETRGASSGRSSAPPRTQPAPRRSPRVSGKARSAARTAPATRSLRAERRKGRRRRAPPSPGRALRRSANEATPGSLYSSIFWKFSSSSLAYSAKFSWIRRRRREIFGETVISIRNK